MTITMRYHPSGTREANWKYMRRRRSMEAWFIWVVRLTVCVYPHGTVLWRRVYLVPFVVDVAARSIDDLHVPHQHFTLLVKKESEHTSLNQA